MTAEYHCSQKSTMRGTNSSKIQLTELRHFAQSCIALAALLMATIGDTASAQIKRSDLSADVQKTGVPFYQWQDDTVKSPKYIVVAVHGAAQEGGAMEALCRELAGYGYMTLAPDLRGSGRWPTLMRQAPTSAFNDFVMSCGDLENILHRLRSEYPKAKIFCIGESAGATVVMSAMTKDASHVKGVVLCSGGTRPKMHNPATMGPDFYKQLMHVTRPVDMSNFMNHYASDDPRTRMEMINDPLGRNKLTALELVGTFNFIQQGKLLAAEMPRGLPALVMQGQNDQIIEPKSGVDLFEKLKCADKKFIEVPDCGHILVGTSYLKPQVVKTIIDWLALHGGPKTQLASAHSIQALPRIQSSDQWQASQPSLPRLQPQSVGTEKSRPLAEEGTALLTPSSPVGQNVAPSASISPNAPMSSSAQEVPSVQPARRAGSLVDPSAFASPP